VQKRDHEHTGRAALAQVTEEINPRARLQDV
jgi:hypothetical protein